MGCRRASGRQRRTSRCEEFREVDVSCSLVLEAGPILVVVEQVKQRVEDVRLVDAGYELQPERHLVTFVVMMNPWRVICGDIQQRLR